MVVVHSSAEFVEGHIIFFPVFQELDFVGITDLLEIFDAFFERDLQPFKFQILINQLPHPNFQFFNFRFAEGRPAVYLAKKSSRGNRVVDRQYRVREKIIKGAFQQESQ